MAGVLYTLIKLENVINSTFGISGDFKAGEDIANKAKYIASVGASAAGSGMKQTSDKLKSMNIKAPEEEKDKN
jgi:hypothetical protein